MMRVKNEARWIHEVVKSTFHLCDKVFILDDHSTDETPDIVRGFDKVVLIESPFEGLNESRDKNYLYDRIIEHCRPEWILCIDGDEVLEGSAGEAIRKGIAGHPEVNAWYLKIEYLWGNRATTRKDRLYSDFWRPSLFRPLHEIPKVPDSYKLLQEFRWLSTPFGRHVNGDKPNLHCSSVPQRRIAEAKRIPARLLHYGYMERDWRVAKLDYYNSIDWQNYNGEDCYRHMCQGDSPKIEELPRVRWLLEHGVIQQKDVDFLLNVRADGSYMHAGPMQLGPVNEGQPWEMSEWAKSQNGW